VSQSNQKAADSIRKPAMESVSSGQENNTAVLRFPGLEDEYVKAELHNGIVVFADIREFTSYMDANSDYAISLLACFRRVLSQCFSGKSLKANANERYTTFAKELGDGVMMIWIAEQGSITDISVEEITGLAFASQEIVKRFFELSADFAPEKYHVGIGIAIGSFQRLLYRDKSNPTLFRYRDYTGGTINLAARLEGLSRPNGVTVCFRALPLNKKKEIIASISAQDFREATQDIRGLGKTQLFQWKLDANEMSTSEARATLKAENPEGCSSLESPTEEVTV
jgi:class 3 adenylate cyclase